MIKRKYFVLFVFIHFTIARQPAHAHSCCKRIPKTFSFLCKESRQQNKSEASLTNGELFHSKIVLLLNSNDLIL